MKIKSEVYLGVKIYFRKHKKFKTLAGFTAGSDKMEAFHLNKDGSIGLSEYGTNKDNALRKIKSTIDRII